MRSLTLWWTSRVLCTLQSVSQFRVSIFWQFILSDNHANIPKTKKLEQKFSNLLITPHTMSIVRNILYKLASLRSIDWGYPTSHEEDQKKNETGARPGVSCPVPVFSRHDHHANSTLSALQLEVRKIPFP